MRKLDPLILLIGLAIALAIIVPARGTFAAAFAQATNLAIALLFFLYGTRLSPQEAWAGLKHWRLHLTILAFTYGAYPLVGTALHTAVSPWLGADLARGLLYLTLVPSTVQSSVAFTSLARGNVAGAIVSASLSNLLGVVVTPLLVMLCMSDATGVTTSGVKVDPSVFGEIALRLLLPFLLGQLARRYFQPLTRTLGATKIVDRGSIAMVVYSAFSAGVTGGIWQHIGSWEIIALVLCAIVLVALMLGLTQLSATLLGFPRPDRIAIAFCGSKKSLATGLPMASILFSTNGAQLALLVVPLMIYHQVQLLISSCLAARYSKQP